MTTEIAILNKSAVALAADSAVTITSGPESPKVMKTYVEANKLFELVKGVPVGLMVYNSAEIAGIPWESLVKSYREKHRLARFDRLDEYVDDFLSYVQKAIPDVEGAIDEEEMLQTLAVPFCLLLLNGIIEELVAEEPSKLERRNLFSKKLDEVDSQMGGLPILDWAHGIDEDEFLAKWHAAIVEMLPSKFKELSLTVQLRKKFATVLLKVILRLNPPEKNAVWSGVVICGFGNEELFPGVSHCRIAGFVEGRLVRVDGTAERVSSSRPALIHAYAQTNEAVMFLQGIDPAVARSITSFWQTWAGGIHTALFEIVKAEAPKMGANQLKRVRAATRRYMNTSWNDFATYMDDVHRRRVEPIEASAAFLSKREIADLAENLVELTSLRNRVSLDRQHETVGGATDVAVISKGDGFVWVKRKHYFSHERNPSWAMQQTLADVVSKMESLSKGEESDA